MTLNRFWAIVLLAAAPVLGRSSSAANAAESDQYEIRVSAGKHDRKQTPVRVPLPDDSPLGSLQSLTLKTPAGETISAQITGPALLAERSGQRELFFILPELKAGNTLTLRADLSDQSAASGEGFAWHDHAGDFMVLKHRDRPIMQYHYAAYDDSSPEKRERTLKVFHHVFSPSGDRIVTGGLSDDPEVHSPHHRGIFFGYMRVNYGQDHLADTWQCWNGAYQAHHRFLAKDAGPVLGRHCVALGWYGPEKVAFAEEERELTAYAVPGGLLIDFASRVNTPLDELKLEADSHHGGVQFRADNEVFAKTSAETIYIRPDGRGQPGETRNWDPEKGVGPKNLPWNAMSFVLGGKRYTVAYLDHPENPKDAIFSEREFGRFGSYFPYTVRKDQPLQVKYRFWLQDGEMAASDVARLSHDFVDPVQVTITAR